MFHRRGQGFNTSKEKHKALNAMLSTVHNAVDRLSNMVLAFPPLADEAENMQQGELASLHFGSAKRRSKPRSSPRASSAFCKCATKG